MTFEKNTMFILAITFFLTIGFINIAGAGEKRIRLSEPRLQPIPESKWNDVQTKLLTPLKVHFKDGKVINIFTTLARNPKLFASWATFGTHILQTSSIPPREREILILRIGWLCQSEYEFGQHTLIGKQTGLTDKDILRITQGPDAEGWNSFDAALLQAADELHKDAFITDATWKRLSAKYNEPQLMDLIFTVGQYNMVCMALNTLGIQLDPGIPGFPAGSMK